MTIKVENGSITYDGQDLQELKEQGRKFLEEMRPPEGTPALSTVKTPYAVFCPTDGQQFLTSDEYGRQLSRPDNLWTCPKCGAASQWDDDNFETFESDLNG